MEYEDIEITFKNGAIITYTGNDWDDYSYDGKFFFIRREGVNIAMYNADEVLSVILS